MHVKTRRKYSRGNYFMVLGKLKFIYYINIILNTRNVILCVIKYVKPLLKNNKITIMCFSYDFVSR